MRRRVCRWYHMLKEVIESESLALNNYVEGVSPCKALPATLRKSQQFAR